MLKNIKTGGQRKLRKLDDEQWLPIPESNSRYLVSNYGRIKSFAYNKTEGCLLKCSVIKGFKIVSLKINKLPKRVYVHKLVAEVWIPRPSEIYTKVRHLDWNLKNNHVSNLQWATLKESIKLVAEHTKLRRIDSKAKFINNSKLKEKDVMLLKSMLQRGVSQSQIAKMFCISEMQVTRIKRGENWGHVVLSMVGQNGSLKL